MNDTDPNLRRREADRRSRARKRALELAESIRFTCAICGGRFMAPDAAGVHHELHERRRQFVRLGGRTVCAVCAEKRFSKRSYRYGGVCAETFVPFSRGGCRPNIIPSFS